MAKQVGVIKIRGSLGGLNFYGKNGEYVRRSAGISKEKLMASPTFKRRRENMREFGGAVMAAQALRQGLREMKHLWGRDFNPQTVKLVRQMMGVASGIRGQRPFKVLAHGHMLRELELAPQTPFRSIFLAPYSAPTLSADRNVVSWALPQFEARSYLNAPRGATAFQLVLVAAVLSDYTYAPEVKAYKAVNPHINSRSAVTFSDHLPLSYTALPGDLTLRADLDLGAPIPDTAGVAVAVGVVFYKRVFGGQYSPLPGGAMRVEVVG